jgi:aminoacyl tRNA synthase complex-interacting multifunctional protein 1
MYQAKNLVGFKSHGMVLCAAETREDGTEKVEFVEPPEGGK